MVGEIMRVLLSSNVDGMESTLTSLTRTGFGSSLGMKIKHGCYSLHEPTRCGMEKSTITSSVPNEHNT